MMQKLHLKNPCMLLYLLAERFIDLDEVHEEDLKDRAEEEAKVLALAEEAKAKRKGQIEGPWQLDAKMRPYEPKTLQLDKAKEILENDKSKK